MPSSSSLTTTNTQLARYFKDEPRFQGVFSQGKPGLKLKKNSFMILNLDKPSGQGTHWVLASSLNNKLIYMNSFGLPPDSQIIHIMRGNKSTPAIQYNTEDEQPLDSSECGEWCMAQANQLLKGGKKNSEELGSGMPISYLV